MGPVVRTTSGMYVSNYKRCECGVEYLDLDSHVKTDLRHKQWQTGDIEIPVPVQPPSGAFPINGERPRLVLGETVICDRCDAKRRKDNDHTSGPNDKGRRCSRCNGWGIIPNQGPVGGHKRRA